MNIATRKTWKAVRDQIHNRILDSTYSPGDKLPKDQDIALEFGCARTTVQRAMRDLAESGIIQRRRKGGTTVRTDPVTRATLDIPVIRQEVEQKGSVYGYQLVKSELAEAPFAVTANFGLDMPEKMLRIEALHRADRQPYIYEDRWISTDTVPEILNVDLSKISANEWLIQNRPYSRCDIRFFAINANQYQADLLETSLGEALFVIERTTWIGSQPVTTVKAVARPGYQVFTQI